MIIRCIILLCMIGGMAMICGTFGYYDLKLGCWLLNHVRVVIRIINRELFRQEGGDHK
jgi:hypothetical protein|nr:MAG TPA: hypothetical protein [Caudoviricetes sp.]